MASLQSDRTRRRARMASLLVVTLILGVMAPVGLSPVRAGAASPPATVASSTTSLPEIPSQNVAYPTCANTNFGSYNLVVPGASTPGVTVYNYSCFDGAPGHNLDTLIATADEGLVSTTPDTTATPGLMANGDIVVVTAYTIYWISVNSSLGVSDGRSYTGSGLIAGEWPIAPASPGSNEALFADVVGANNWAPNWLLPGSTAAGSSAMQNGLGVRVVPSCGTDASSTPGAGTFVIQGTPDQASLATPPPPANDPDEHLIQFSGLLDQEDTGTQAFDGNTTATDCQGDSTPLSFVLTYRFHDALDPTTLYNGVVPEARINRVEVALTPLNSNLNVADFGMGDDLESRSSSQPLPLTMTDNTEGLQRFTLPGDPCGFINTAFSPGTPGGVCGQTASPGLISTQVQESTALEAQDNPPRTSLPVGNIAAFQSADGNFALSYLHPDGFSTTVPAVRDSLVWNNALGGVSSVETQFVGATDPAMTWTQGATVDVGQDEDLGQALDPPNVGGLSASPTTVPAAGGTVTLSASTLAGYTLNSDPPVNVGPGHTVTIPPNEAEAPTTYTFTLVPQSAEATKDAPPPVTVTQAAAPVAVFSTTPPLVLQAIPAQFAATASYDPSGTIATYAWNFGDGTTATGVQVSHTFVNTGYHNVTLTVTDNTGQEDSTLEHLDVVQPTEVAQITAGGAGTQNSRRPASEAAARRVHLSPPHR